MAHRRANLGGSSCTPRAARLFQRAPITSRPRYQNRCLCATWQRPSHQLTVRTDTRALALSSSPALLTELEEILGITPGSLSLSPSPASALRRHAAVLAPHHRRAAGPDRAS